VDLKHVWLLIKALRYVPPCSTPKSLHASQILYLCVLYDSCNKYCSSIWWIPDGVIGIFHWHNSFGRTVVNSASERFSTKNISWGVKAVSAQGWQPYHHVPTISKSGILNLLERSGPEIGLYRYCFIFTSRSVHHLVIVVWVECVFYKIWIELIYM